MIFVYCNGRLENTAEGGLRELATNIEIPGNLIKKSTPGKIRCEKTHCQIRDESTVFTHT